MTMLAMIAAVYLSIGWILCLMLRVEAKPSSWIKYPMMIFGWPVVIYVAIKQVNRARRL